MKKVLLLIFVLGLTGSANAAITDGLIFTVNGQPQAAEITLMPSQTIEIGLNLPAGHTISGYVLEWEILGGRATFDWSGVTFPIVFVAPSKITTIPEPLPNKVRMTGTQLLDPAREGSGVVMQGLILKCNTTDPSPNDPTIMTVYTRGTKKVDGVNIQVSPGTLVHTLVIHQIPEPGTVLLLGLGGLFLRKRK